MVFFFIIDPIGNLLIFNALTQRLPVGGKVKAAALSCSFAFFLLLSFCWGGQGLLSYFGISEASFSIAAGILLLIPGIRLVEEGSPMKLKKLGNLAQSHATFALAPLGTPLLAGPGAIAAAMKYSRDPQGFSWLLFSYTLIAILLNLLLCFFIFALSSFWLMDSRHEVWLQALAKIAGVILCALAVNFILQGLSLIL